MLSIIADLYSPLLALCGVYYLRFAMTKSFAIAFVAGYLYAYGFAFIELYFGWWQSMGANFSSHTVAVAVIVFALLSVNFKVGCYAFVSMMAYGFVMTLLEYHSWFDILTTILVCLPCWLLFSVVNRRAFRSSL